MFYKESELKIPVGNTIVRGNLNLPAETKRIVLFAHGSGSGRFSPRNQYVARELNKSKISTLLFDLLTIEEEQADIVTTEYRFNIKLLSQRLIGVTKWLKEDPNTGNLSFGYFGASTGAAAALIAAANLKKEISAVVSRGGRPDLAGDYLHDLVSPTLLIVGGLDKEVIELNRRAQSRMTNQNKLEIVPGATHLFEEPGKLEIVAMLSKDWFLQYLR
jgi:predicted alpha/beta-hydrolase family hydrolase